MCDWGLGSSIELPSPQRDEDYNPYDLGLIRQKVISSPEDKSSGSGPLNPGGWVWGLERARPCERDIEWRARVGGSERGRRSALADFASEGQSQTLWRML